MVRTRVLQVVFAIAVLSLVGVLLVQAGVVSGPWTAEQGEVQVADENSTEPKAVIDVAVADTPGERYTGLSEHDSLEPGTGMLFVHSDEDERTYVMREMDFDIDIVFIGADREITTIHHARAPEPGEDGNDLEYSGQAQWVLEVPRGYTNETGIEVGDEVTIELDDDRGIALAVTSDASEAASDESRANATASSVDARTYFDS